MLYLLVAHAFAQSPMPIQLGGADPSDRWMVAQTASVRFFGEAVPGPTFEAGEEVEVLVEDGGQVRVRAADRYGWVPKASLTDQAPAEPTTAPAGGLLGGVPALPPAKK